MDPGTVHSHPFPDDQNPVKNGERSVWPLRGVSDLLPESGESVHRKGTAEGPRDKPGSWGHLHTAHLSLWTPGTF